MRQLGKRRERFPKRESIQQVLIDPPQSGPSLNQVQLLGDDDGGAACEIIAVGAHKDGKPAIGRGRGRYPRMIGTRTNEPRCVSVPRGRMVGCRVGMESKIREEMTMAMPHSWGVMEEKRGC